MGDNGEFLTSAPKEVKTFSWRIQDFSSILGVGLPSPTMEFEAGQSLGLPSTWTLSIQKTTGLERDEDGDCKEILLLVLNLKGYTGNKPKNVKCVATIKSKDGAAKDFLCIMTSTRDSPNCYKRMGFLDDIITNLDDNDELTIHLKITFFGHNMDTKAGEKAPCVKKMVEQSRNDICNNLGSLLEDGYNSDFTIQVKQSDGEIIEMKVHKNILGSRSPVFRTMFESQMAEQEEGKMLIQDLSPECVKILLKWIYTGNLDENWTQVPGEMVNAGDKYGLPPLLSFLDANLHLVCNFDNAIKLGKAAQLHGLKNAAKKITDFIKDNIERFLPFFE